MAPRRPSVFDGLSRVWFPAALVLLLLLAVPGAVLLALNLLNFEAPVNRWLQDRFHLSYHIPVPWWAALLLLLVPLGIVLLYFLKLKRKPLQVPSTFLWKKSIEDLHVNTLFQWLRDNVLLLLQVLTLLLLIYAVMAFQVHGATTEGVHYILMLDNSASMGATDVSPSRLEVAKEQALREIDGHSDDDFGMVLVFSSSAEIRQSYTSDRNRLREAVKAIEQTQRPTRIEEALSLASSLANPNRSTENEATRPPGEEPGKERQYVAAEGIPTEVHLFSDGRFPDVPDFSQGNLDLRMHLIGEPGPDKVDNVGLTTLNAVRDDRDPTKIQVLVNVRNYRKAPAAVRVRLDVRINGELQGFFEKLAQPQGQLGDGSITRVDRAAGQIGIIYKNKEQLLNANEVQISGADGRAVDLGLLGTGHAVEVVEAGGAVTELRVQPVQGRAQREDKETKSVVDVPGEGFVAFELADVDDRANVALQAQIADARDKFPLDDTAWLVLGVVRKARVLVVGPPNRVLEAFFDHEATRKVADVTHIEREDLKSEEKYGLPARQFRYDLVVFDRCAPEREQDLPQANTFFIDALPPPWKKDGLPRVKNPRIKGWLTNDPLLRQLAALYDVGVDEAFLFSLDPEKNPGVPPRTPRLIETDQNTVVLFSLARQSYSDVVLTFPLVTDEGAWNTNWPLHPSFPLFLRNVLYTLGNVSDAAGEETVQPGQVKTIRPDVPVSKIEVVPPREDGRPNPDGQGLPLERGTRPAFAFGDTDRVGIYTVKWDGAAQRSFAVNLLDADESNLEPRPVEEIHIGSGTLTVGQTRSQARETWKWVAAAALVLLLLEWYVYNRRIFV